MQHALNAYWLKRVNHAADLCIALYNGYAAGPTIASPSKYHLRSWISLQFTFLQLSDHAEKWQQADYICEVTGIHHFNREEHHLSVACAKGQHSCCQ
jgi:hypothetical protein